jgi:hypothetical protein
MDPSEDDYNTTSLSESRDKIKRKAWPWDSLEAGNDTADKALINPTPAPQPPRGTFVSVNDNARH